MGLLEYIRSAKTVAEIERLLAQGAKYEFATPDTRRKWQRAAELRTSQLETKSK